MLPILELLSVEVGIIISVCIIRLPVSPELYLTGTVSSVQFVQLSWRDAQLKGKSIEL